MLISNVRIETDMAVKAAEKVKCRAAKESNDEEEALLDHNKVYNATNN